MVSFWWLTLYSLAGNGMIVNVPKECVNVEFRSISFFFLFHVEKDHTDCIQSHHELDTAESKAIRLAFWFLKTRVLKRLVPKRPAQKESWNLLGSSDQRSGWLTFGSTCHDLVYEWLSFWFLASKTTTLANCHGSWVITQNYKMLIAMNICLNKTNPHNVMDPMFLHWTEWKWLFFFKN